MAQTSVLRSLLRLPVLNSITIHKIESAARGIKSLAAAKYLSDASESRAHAVFSRG